MFASLISNMLTIRLENDGAYRWSIVSEGATHLIWSHAGQLRLVCRQLKFLKSGSVHPLYYQTHWAGYQNRPKSKFHFKFLFFSKCQPLTFPAGVEHSLATPYGHFKQVNEHGVAFVYASHPLPFTALADSDVPPFSLRITDTRLTKIFCRNVGEICRERELRDLGWLREEGRKGAPSVGVWCTRSFFTLMMSTSSSSWLWQESYNNLLSS